MELHSNMTPNYRVIVALATVSLLTACTTVALAPGADKVRVTYNAQDVASCTAVWVMCTYHPARRALS